MKFSYLKKIRTAVSLLFFFSIAVLFVDISGIIPPQHYDKITFFQFLPSLLSFVNITGLAAAGFIFVMIITLLFGRVYCSSICPLGTLQDIIIFIGKNSEKKENLLCPPPINF
jgi:polyferredoxin